MKATPVVKHHQILAVALFTVATLTASHAQDCAALGHLRVDGYTLEHLQTSAIKAGQSPDSTSLPAYCLLRGEIDPHVGTDGTR